ncbi:bifunctional hydroxymethylpyrimidine kinase/phosphomethylpyrimidine kinase [Maricaulis sp.]|uniref:bifunctional hydroxymethylpyrimidine kinase/phosphomethylpyrimidine kinase n=1 Tax=Maricaulis sp. TaxID=1486257 RepID=UPI00261E5062|nr:bifunctional hydroxymethylpyrimidine kinase/phosphomethylpyrimidine kinase [Maricaulis sp.]
MSEAPRGRVLIIAGSDSGGGAGIQADIKAVSAMGGFAMTAVTAITVQNTLGVTGIHPVPDDTVADQMRAVLSDLGADAIKTGMLATASLIETVASVLEQEAPAVPLILDPVMVATSGDALVDTTAAEAIKSRLLPRAALVTPNIPEAERLTGLTIGDLDTQIAAAEALVEAGARAALVKGGHMSGEILRDVLVSPRGLQIFEHERLDTPHTHGTGCTLASAISSLLAQGHALPEAVRRAGDYLHNAIRHAPGFGAGHGPVDHFWMLRG